MTLIIQENSYLESEDSLKEAELMLWKQISLEDYFQQFKRS